MKDRILTDRYAKALFAAAQERSVGNVVSEDLKKINALFSEKKDLFAWFSARGGDKALRIAVISSVSKALSLDGISLNFLSLLIQKNRLGAFPQMGDRFNELMDYKEGVVRGTVTAADLETIQTIKDGLSAAISKKFGLKVVLSGVSSPDIVGGAILKIGDDLWDASIERKLTLIKESLCR